MIGKKVKLRDGTICIVQDKIKILDEDYDYEYYRQTGIKRNEKLIRVDGYLVELSNGMLKTVCVTDLHCIINE